MQQEEKVQRLKGWLEEKNIEQIDIIDISNISIDIDIFIIGTAENDRQARAAADFIEEKCSEFDIPVRSREGKEYGKWILIDLGDTIIHIFLKEERATYNLEKLWADGKFKTDNREDK